MDNYRHRIASALDHRFYWLIGSLYFVGSVFETGRLRALAIIIVWPSQKRWRPGCRVAWRWLITVLSDSRRRH